MSVADTRWPASSKNSVIPSLRPRIAAIMSPLQLNLDVHPGRQVQVHQRVYRLLRRLEDVDQPLVRAQFEMLHRLLVDMRGADHGEDAAAGRQRHGAADAGSGALDGVHDLLGRLVQDLMVEGLELDPDLLLHYIPPSHPRRPLGRMRAHYATIPVTTPAPTVWPP